MAAHQSPLKRKKFKNASKPSSEKKKKTKSAEGKKKQARAKQSPEKVKKTEDEDGLKTIFEMVSGASPAEVKEKKQPTIRWKHGYTASGKEATNANIQWIYIGLGIIVAFLLYKYFF